MLSSAELHWGSAAAAGASALNDNGFFSILLFLILSRLTLSLGLVLSVLGVATPSGNLLGTLLRIGVPGLLPTGLFKVGGAVLLLVSGVVLLPV